MFKFKKEAGAMAQLLLVIAAVVLVAIGIAFLIMKMSEKPPAPATSEGPKVELPVYEEKLVNIRFVFMSAIDFGKVLKASSASADYSTEKDLTTTEKFIMVTVGAQNKGTLNVEEGSWDIGDIIDAEGHHFVPLDEYMVAPWLPKKNFCGALLKPEFDPTPCVKIYDVSKLSSKFKIEILTGPDNTELESNGEGAVKSMLDLIVK